ncbi:23518_t:CDS:2 [Dentiscutata erythropus]|uniref:23518_t:CDS:1 n=1 Tax=Dentiscutata erythropus TaxID=1348616 RepID=A0A9N9N4J7_9GLOM|nr:23518_t:CDS:2 [Dentiscutata erythropus]
MRVFNKSDKVLLYDAAKANSHLGKFLPRWLGLFIIAQRVAQDVYKLKTMEGRPLDTPHIALLLKRS